MSKSRRNRQRQHDRGSYESIASGGSDMKKLYIILGAVVVIVGFMMLRGGPRSLIPAVREPVEVVGLDDAATLVRVAQGITRGDPDAPITIVEFGDYQCPGCAQFASLVEPSLLAAYVETGQAKFVYYDFPIISAHRNAFLAARAARCAGDQARYWEYHGMLFGNQQSWALSTNPTNMFVGYSGRLGLDEGAFESCLRSDQHAETVSANMRLGEEMGVTATPTVLVQSEGEMPQVVESSFQALQEMMETLLAEGSDEGGS